METCMIETAAGNVRGRRHPSGAWEFLGIPYGEDTGGENRFRPPRPAQPWAGTRDAFSYGPSCPQGDPPENPETALPLGDPLPPPSEDCLKLNVWTPAGNGRGSRPVMVWLHGGGFAIGHASKSTTNGGNLAAFGDAVIVSLNHRLNIFGFLFLDDATQGAVSNSANLGLLDIILALEWVRDNIGAFGGDPGNVTVFGLSGGGRKICNLMAMPAAAGLFHRAIVQSGAHPRCIPRDRASGFAAGFLRFLGLSPRDAGALRAIPAAELQDRAVSFCGALRDPAVANDAVTAMWMMSPVVDGQVLPDDPWSGSGPAVSRNVPLLIGTTKDEAAVHLARRPDAGQLTWDELEERCRAVFGDRGPALAAVHAAARPDATPWSLLVGIASEDRRLMSLDIAERKAHQAGAPAYVYLFAWETDHGRFGAAHGMDMPFVFRTLDQSPWTGRREDRFALSEAMSSAWLAFARTGIPAVPGGPAWPAYEPVRRATMILDVPLRVEDDPWSAQRRAFGTTDKCMPWEPETFAARIASPFEVRAPA